MIDILMATYNGETFLRAQLDSILQQSNQDWQLIIRDDCSTDATVQIIKEYQLLRPEQIRLIRAEQPSGSAQNNFFQLLQYSTAEYVMFADQDDVWLKDKVQNTLEKMRELEEQYGAETPLLVHTDLAVVDAALRVINPSLFQMHNMDAARNQLNNIVVQNIVTGCTMMVNRALLDLVTEIPVHAVMHDMWLALVAAAFGQIGFLDRATMLYRQHGQNVKGARDMRSLLFIAEKLSELKIIKQTLSEKYQQAEEFLDIYQMILSLQQRQILQAYSLLGQQPIWKKYQVLKKHQLYMKGIIRNLGQILL